MSVNYQVLQVKTEGYRDTLLYPFPIERNASSRPASHLSIWPALCDRRAAQQDVQSSIQPCHAQ